MGRVDGRREFRRRADAVVDLDRRFRGPGSAARHAVDARLAIPLSFEDLKPISNPAVEHLNLINFLDILSQVMWTLSSAARMMLDVTTPAVIRASAMRLVVAGEISRCSKTILRPQATWATIAIGPTQ